MNIERGYNEYSKQVNAYKALNVEDKTLKSAKNTENLKQTNNADGFDFSKTAKTLSNAIKSTDDENVNADRLKVLKQSINNGTYKVDVDKLADKMMREVTGFKK